MAERIISKRCEHIVETLNNFYYQQHQCNRQAYFIIHYQAGGDKLA